MTVLVAPVKLPAKSDALYQRYVTRGESGFASIEADVRAILARVKAEGDAAVIDYTKQFDNVDLAEHGIEVTAEEKEEALSAADSNTLKALMRAAHNVRTVHLAQLEVVGRDASAECETVDGVEVWQTFRPYPRVGCYAPGGLAAYPSSVLMMGVPADVAGVKETILCTPPTADGTVNPAVLVAAEVAKIDRVFKIGGAQGIAAMAYGTETVPRATKLLGPGNAYVTAAKQICAAQSSTRIDAPAGPSEVGIYANPPTDPTHVAADLVAQCEHGSDSISVLITVDEGFANAVSEAVDAQLKDTPRREIAEAAWREWGAIWVAESETEALAVMSEMAFEHVELVVENAEEVLPSLKTGGSVFLGPYAPVACGDYATGTNHVLPTGGWGRMYGGLHIWDYGVVMFVQSLTKDGLRTLAPAVTHLATVEGLHHHATSVAIRLDGKLGYDDTDEDNPHHDN